MVTFAKKSLGKKDSYFRQHLEKTGNLAPEKPQRPALPPVSDACRQSFEEGKLLLLDKPIHWTSFDVVRKVRNAIKIKKVGHAGTLDPLATGLLIVCTGKFTKKINEFMSQEKEYTGTITLGSTTPTYDLESLPENEQPVSGISAAQIEAVRESFVGEQQQMPPLYSAIKKEGVALYELARRGVDVELEPRPVHIFSFEISSEAFPILHFKVSCSKGTYIRSLAHDFGARLGCGAHLSALRRTRIGILDVQDAIGVEDFMTSLDAHRVAGTPPAL